MKKIGLITLVLITNICLADQLDGVGYAVMALGIFLLIFIAFVGSTIQNYNDIKKGKRQNKWLNIRAIATLSLSILFLCLTIGVKGIAVVEAMRVGLLAAILVNAHCLIKNNSEKGKRKV